MPADKKSLELIYSLSGNMEKFATPLAAAWSLFKATGLGTKVAPIISSSIRQLATKGTRYIDPARTGFGIKGSKIYSEGMEAMQKSLGKDRLKTMFGTSSDPSKLMFREITRPETRLFSSPKQWATERAGNMARNIIDVKEKGLFNFLGKEWKGSKTFKKTFTHEGKTYEVMSPRSLIGRTLNPMVGTGPGFGGLTLLTNAKTPEGKKQSMGKRLGQAGFDAATWGGPLAPVTLPIMGAKITYDIGKSFLK